VAQYPAHGNNGEELCRASRFAVRRAEATGEKYAIFDKAHASQKIEILQRLTKLREAIAGDELIFHYQPKLDLRTKEISSVEALVRWPQASGEILSPAAFIPAAEGTALITQLSAWGLQTAVRQLAHWQKDKVHTDLRIAVNLSALDLRDDNTVRLIKEFLALYGVNASRLEIEVTETTIIDDLPAATRCLEQIKELGVHIAIDDFGTGHAGLVQLKNLPVHSLKIDQTFVKNMLTDSKDRQIVRSAIDLGHNLGLEIIAEGVESKEVLAELGQYGCDIVQGYGIARPLPEAALRTWLKSRPPL
jgi:EAL domain-containing protein (putative c-di-GMP-specific phosphodiesterase class I)